MKHIVVLVLFILSACTNRHPAPVRDVHHHNKISSAQPLSKQNNRKVDYVHVKKGDTLYSLGFRYDIGFKSLAKINHIAPPYRIYPGQKLKLYADKPVTTTTLTQVSKDYSKSKTSVTKPKHPIKVVYQKPPAKKPVKQTLQESQPAPASNSRWMWPVKGKIISTFSHTDTARKGIDISSRLGADVYASNNGTVVYSGDGLRGYGELIIIKHNNNLLSAYAHNSKRLVKEGQSIKQGSVIAKTGKGTDGKPLLHFEIRKNGQPVNPLSYLPKK